MPQGNQTVLAVLWIFFSENLILNKFSRKAFILEQEVKQEGKPENILLQQRILLQSSSTLVLEKNE